MINIRPALETNVITIEKNIPIPDRNHHHAISKYHFVKNMEIGDSFKINGKMKFTVHTLKGTGPNPKSIRVWRVK